MSSLGSFRPVSTASRSSSRAGRWYSMLQLRTTNAVPKVARRWWSTPSARSQSLRERSKNFR